MKQRSALVHVSYELLAAALELPEDMHIVALAQTPADILSGAVQFVVEHADLPVCLEGAAPRVLTIENIRAM